MPYELDHTDTNDSLEIAYSSAALFEQYDDTDMSANAMEDCYDNLYPAIG